ncbi:hypothetical protein BDP81DRAFT_438927 [Colletotrichum phormii]|uniref:Uncharacterized protein n=1 Tax=Colletotrichum phormii TaxID=359342 RepID=A0AAI9ZI78_9PEZI|nr:uncharacterized protein BDP81DRAFT_438927 [Colletotrichum phormii]KAK1623856.1 hypothetical protein BDP81DRAFT_438927 [Colletotrichum phormii]
MSRLKPPRREWPEHPRVQTTISDNLARPHIHHQKETVMETPIFSTSIPSPLRGFDKH